jgi:outer membrane protein TolC
MDPPRRNTTEDPPALQNMSLEQCLEAALENNRWRPASQLAVEAAEAQRKQALSSWWPTLSGRTSVVHMDEPPNFLFPARSFFLDIPMASLSLPITIPAMDIKLMDSTSLFGSLSLSFPVYTGGLRPAIIQLAKSGVEAAKQEARRTDLQVVFDVKRMYYTNVLAQNLHKIGSDALARLEVTLRLTENLYKKGSGRVNKTDFLRNKMVVEGLRSLVMMLESNVQLAQAALVNTMGLVWNTPITLAANEIPFEPLELSLNQLVAESYAFNPDWARLEAGLTAAGARVKEARSGYFPKMGLIGSLNYISNSYDKGMVTPQNKSSWAVGVGLDIPIFNGFLTPARVQEAKARLKQMEQQQILLKEGLALQVKHIFLQVDRSQKQQEASRAALDAASQNRDLNVRAYQDELVETQDVIEAQILESFMEAQYQKVLYDHAEARAHLDFVVGEEVVKLIR